jgi:hypothetical protein
MFVHTVFFWLKETAPAGEAERLAASCRELLSKIPAVRKLEAGRPAMTPREVVDNSYDVGLCVLLDDAAGHDVYQVHEFHQQFIARHKEHWKRVQVYDFK